MTRVTRINLTTESIRLRNLSRRRRRAWGAAVLTCAMLCGLVWQWCSRSGTEASSAESTLAGMLEQARRGQKRLTAQKARAAQIAAQFAALELMRGPDAWSGALAFVAAATPDSVTLSRLNAAVQDQTAAPAVGPGAGSARPAERTAGTADAAAPRTYRRVLHLTGYAADHVDVATFLRRLQESRMFSRVALVRSAQERAGPLLALSFGVECER